MNRPTTAQSVANLLGQPEGPLKALLDRLALLEGMDHNLQPLLPASLRGQCRVTAVDGVTVELTARQAAVATRLRYLVPQLLVGLHTAGYPQLTEIRIRVTPAS